MEGMDIVDTEEEDSHRMETKRESGSEEIDEAHNSPRKRLAGGSSPTSGMNDWKKVEERDIPRKRMRIRHPLRLPDDGHLWQQYGQKRIKGTEYMRKYYRCGLFKMLGCPAKRTVDFHKDNLRKAAVSHLAKHNHLLIPNRQQNPLMERPSLQPIATPISSLVPPSTTSVSPNMSPVIPSNSADMAASFPKVPVRMNLIVSEDHSFSNKSPSAVTDSMKSSPPTRFNSLEAGTDAQFQFESNTGRATGNLGGLLSGEALLKALLLNIGLSKAPPIAHMDSCGSPPSQGSQRDANSMERGMKDWPTLEGGTEGGTPPPEAVTNVTQTGVMSSMFVSMLSQINAEEIKERQMREEVEGRDRERERQEAEEREEQEERKMREVTEVQERSDREERERDWERERERKREEREREEIERQEKEKRKMESEREGWARREEERWQSVDAGWLGLAMTSKMEAGRKTGHMTQGLQENGREKDHYLAKLSEFQGGYGLGSRKRIAQDAVKVEPEDSHGGHNSPRKKMFCLNKEFEVRSVKLEQSSLKEEDSRELERVEEKLATDGIPEELERLQEREEAAGSGQSTIAQDDPASEEDTENRQEGDKIVRRRRIHHRLGIPYDGYFWEKYGQKHIKGTRYMRNYYRCAMYKKTECPAKRTIDYHKDTFHCERTAYMAHHSHPMLSLHRRGLQGMQAMAAIHNQSLNQNLIENFTSTLPSTTAVSPISPMDTPTADPSGSPSSEGSQKSASGGEGGGHMWGKQRGDVAVDSIGQREPAFERELMTGEHVLSEREASLVGKMEKEKENWKNLDPGWLCLAMDITPSGVREVEGTCNENGRVGVC